MFNLSEKESNMKERIHVFDICGTLYNSNTTFDFLEYFFKTNKSYCFYNKIRKSFLWCAINHILRKCCHKDMTRMIALHYLRGYSREELLAAAQVFYKSFLVNHQNNAVLDQLHYLQHMPEEKIVIVSATLDFIAEVIAEQLSCTVWYSSKLQYQSGICQGFLICDLLENKVEKIFNDTQIRIESVYTDDISDVALLNIAQTQNVIVYPKTRNKWEKVIEKKIWDVNIIEC